MTVTRQQHSAQGRRTRFRSDGRPLAHAAGCHAAAAPTHPGLSSWASKPWLHLCEEPQRLPPVSLASLAWAFEAHTRLSLLSSDKASAIWWSGCHDPPTRSLWLAMASSHACQGHRVRPRCLCKCCCWLGHCGPQQPVVAATPGRDVSKMLGHVGCRRCTTDHFHRAMVKRVLCLSLTHVTSHCSLHPRVLPWAISSLRLTPGRHAMVSTDRHPCCYGRLPLSSCTERMPRVQRCESIWLGPLLRRIASTPVISPLESSQTVPMLSTGCCPLRTWGVPTLRSRHNPVVLSAARVLLLC